jgi:hypothetical protein
MQARLGWTALVLLCVNAQAGNYMLTIDGKPYEIDLDKSQSLPLPDGRKLQVMLERKKVMTYEASRFAFDYPAALQPSYKDLGEGIYQTMMASPLGTVIIVQEYRNNNPSDLIDFMLREMNKEEIQYGYAIKTSHTERKLANGVVFKGKTSVSKFKDTEYTRSVLAYGERDSGLLVMTQLEKEAPNEDRELLNLFWRTLQIHLQ